MDKVVSAAGRGEGLGSVQRDLADLAGVQPEVAEKMVTDIASDLDSKMSRSLVQGLGIDQVAAQEALDWMYENLPKQHVSAMFAGALHGDTQALSSAWERYRLMSRKQYNQ